MNFGELNKIIDSIKKHIMKELKKDKNPIISNDYLLVLLKKINPKILKKYDKANFELVTDIFYRFFNSSFTFDKNLSFENGNNGFRN